MSLIARLCVVGVVALVAVAVAVAADSPSDTSGEAGAPGQVCEGLKVKGKKTDEQRAAFKACIQDAVAERKADRAKADEADGKRVPRKQPSAR
jgi:Spy/CpxP family protein refolding chaperone